jgi:hypothetical protein
VRGLQTEVSRLPVARGHTTAPEGRAITRRRGERSGRQPADILRSPGWSPREAGKRGPPGLAGVAGGAPGEGGST